jgi:hypothetical protein
LYLGYAYLLCNDAARALEAFRDSIAVRDELGQPNLRTEPMAGLIQTALLQNDAATAISETEKIISYLADGGTLEGTEEPLRVQYACYLALEKIQDPRASAVLQSAVQLLEAQVSKLGDERARQMFIENVPWRLALHTAAKRRGGDDA